MDNLPTRVPENNPIAILMLLVWHLFSMPAWLLLIVNAKKWQLNFNAVCIIGCIQEIIAFIAFWMWFVYMNKPVENFYKRYNVKRTMKIIPKPETETDAD